MANSGVQPAVASMSIGAYLDPVMNLVVQGMIDAGITVVAAAGNSDGDACRSAPARGPNVSEYTGGSVIRLKLILRSGNEIAFQK